MISNSDDKRVGYLQVRVEDGNFVGGILVVNELGIPKDFFYTSPLKPDRLQFIIYGDSLSSYLKIDVISAKLLASVKEKPILWFTDDDEILQNADRLGVGMAVVKKTVRERLTSVGSVVQEKEGELIIQAVDLLPPFMVRYSGISPEEIASLIVSLSSSMDVLEPFTRLKEALQWIFQNQGKS